MRWWIWQRGGAKKIYDLNQDGFADSFTGDLAFDADRGVLYVLDQANFRLVAIDVRKQRVLSSVRLGRLPFALALSPDKRKAYVTNIGMFEYKPVPGVDPTISARPACRFRLSDFRRPRRARARGARRPRGRWMCPGLGDPNVQEANSRGRDRLWRIRRRPRSRRSSAPGCRSAKGPTAAAAHPAWWLPRIAFSSRTGTTIPSR